MSEGTAQLGARGDGKVWNSCCGEGDWESAGAKYQTAGLRLEGAEGAAVFRELTLQCLALSPPTFCSLELEAGSRRWHDPGWRWSQISVRWWLRVA